MFRSLFGKRKKDEPAPSDTSIRSARPGDVVVVSGFNPLLEDAFFIVESRSRFESPFARWHELVGSEEDRHATIDWSDDDGLFVTISEQTDPMGLQSIGLEYDDMVRLDEENSIDNFVIVDGEKYGYQNSHEATYFKDDGKEGVPFYMWEFVSEDRKKLLSVSKYEGMPFEVYISEVIDPERVSVFKR
jgi:hypothetical protein